jgi:murein DD-endopeptidase MepM/ murein hydrolase activator NlpD
MKPQQILFTALLIAPLGVPLLAAIATDNLSSSVPDDLLVSALSNERVWVKVRQTVSVEELSLQLNMDETRLARLNEVDEDHQFRRGEWLVLPSTGFQRFRLVAALDPNELRRSPPLEAPPPIVASVSTGVVKLGDNLMRIAERYGLTISELIRLNPGLESARLVVGSQVRLAQSAPTRNRLLLGLLPSTSGGISWPETPEYEPSDRSQPAQPFRGGSSLGYVWPSQGVFTSGYGWRWGRMHKGIDVANNVGTPIVAVQRGRVSFAGWHDGGYGFLVEIIHDDGTMTRYAHNSRLLVQKDQQVDQGQVISQMGSTGRSTGPHLHFEIHPPGQGAANPLQYLPPRA